MAVRLICISGPVLRTSVLVLASFLSLLPSTGLAQCSLSCNQNLQISLDVSGQVLITPQIIAPSAQTSCPGALEVKLYNAFGVLLPNPLTCANIGTDVTATVRHLQSGNSCSGTLTVQDALAPVLSCANKFIWCNQDPSPYETGFPALSDNCTPANNLVVNWFDDETSFPCGVFQNGVPVAKRIDRSWVAEDAAGNTATCLQHIWLKHITIADVTFPPHHNNFVLPALSCGQDPEDLDLTGRPTVEGIPVDISTICELSVLYSDQTINICPPAGITILRTWTAVDFCSGALSNRVQFIKVEDVVAPTITPPADLTVGTDGFLCTGSALLPPASTFDSCSPVTTLPAWDFGSGYGPFHGIPEGTHTVVYTATDACGNSASASMRVTVVDQSPPQAICPASLQVSLSSGGTAYLPAATLDAGSSDNCSAVTLSVSRDGDNFFPAIELSCADLGLPVLLSLKVTDAVGLENLCTVDVTARDFLKPLLQCPADVTLSCLQDPADLSLTGQATATDNCLMQSLGFVDVNDISSCHIGTVSRTWKATDAAGNTKTCVQHIALNVLSTVMVTFPANTTVNDCAGNGLVPPALSGQVSISGQFCSPLSITYTDQLFNVPPPSCFRVLRSWKVIDWCVYSPNGGQAGIWEHTQVIDVADQTAPVLTIPDDLIVSADPASCQASLVLPDAGASDCSPVVTISHNSQYATLAGKNASGLYPPGLHLITFTAADACGNTAQKTLFIVVKDSTLPVAVCQSGVSVQMQSGGFAMLTAAQVNGGSSDNCTPAAELVLSVSSDTFVCQQVGIQPVVLTVTDAEGNSSTCTALINVQDPTQICSGGISHVIEGDIRTETGDTVRMIPVQLLADGFSEWTDCDTTGHFFFDDVPGGNLYHLKPRNNALWLNGLTTYDLVLISKHILGLQALDSPYKMIAADANKSGSVTTSDIVQLRKLILGILDTVPGNTSWRFVPSGYTFDNPQNPFAAPFPEEIIYPGLDTSYMGQDFVGFKVGDMNNTTDAAHARSPGDTLYVYVPDIPWVSGSALALPVCLPGWKGLDGFQFELHFDPELFDIARLVFSDPGLLGEANIFRRVAGSIAVSWNPVTEPRPESGDTLLFTVYGSARQNTGTVFAVRLSEDRLVAEAYRGDNAAATVLQLQFAGAEKQRALARAHTNRPNPFTESTEIPFYLALPGEASLDVADVLGRVVYAAKRSFPAGEQVWEIGRLDLPGAGLYTYRLRWQNGVVHGGKMVLLSR